MTVERVEVGELDLGPHVDLDGELQVAGEVFASGHAVMSASGRPSGRRSFSSTAWRKKRVEALVDRVLEHGDAADALVDDGRRHLALAEAGDRHVLGDVAVGVVDARPQLLRRDGDGELDARRAQLLDGGGDHGGLRDPRSGSALGIRRSRRVGATGFEPAASRSQSGRSTKLSYAPRSVSGLRDAARPARGSGDRLVWAAERPGRV